jgi:hypothetical protein
MSGISDRHKDKPGRLDKHMRIFCLLTVEEGRRPHGCENKGAACPANLNERKTTVMNPVKPL